MHLWFAPWDLKRHYRTHRDCYGSGRIQANLKLSRALCAMPKSPHSSKKSLAECLACWSGQVRGFMFYLGTSIARYVLRATPFNCRLEATTRKHVTHAASNDRPSLQLARFARLL